MKRLLFVIALSATILTKGFGQLFPTCSYPSSVDLFGLCEISIQLPWTFSNPYNPDTINVFAIFTGPDNSSYTVNAFYYEDYTFQQDTDDGHELASHNPANDGWRVRFTPTVLGTWNFYIRAFDKNGELNLSSLNGNHTFSCTAVSKANGFITPANSKFLKREIVKRGSRQYHSYYPVGPNIAWYNCLDYCHFEEPLGIYDYENHIDSLYNNANYMRVWINRYNYLSLYGPEFTQKVNGEPTVYFDSIINQKDAAELDHIITYASQHDVSIMVCFLSHGEFLTSKDHCNQTIWANNPFNTILGLSSPCDFFTDSEAKRIMKNLIRYIISRWGYATNVLCWELCNEVEQSNGLCSENELEDIGQDIVDWHNEMAAYIRSTDPFGHCVSSSLGKINGYIPCSDFYQNLDIFQIHNYQNIQRARSRFEIPYSLFININNYGHGTTPAKPVFMAEFGFSQSGNSPHTDEKDPHGVELHNALWSSMFSASIGPASFWRWSCLDSCGLYKRFKPVMNFSQQLPVLSDSFSAHSTVQDNHTEVLVVPNGLRTYYMSNAVEDSIMGWSQDTMFTFQSLRWLTDSVRMQNDTVFQDSTVTVLPAFYFVDSVPPFDPNGYIYTLNPLKRPAPGSNSNVITLPITNQPVGTTYQLQWYNSETGFPFNVVVVNIPVQQDPQGNKFLSFQFPSSIRNLKNHTINNTFGDAVFVLTKRYQDPFKQQ